MAQVSDRYIICVTWPQWVIPDIIQIFHTKVIVKVSCNLLFLNLSCSVGIHSPYLHMKRESWLVNALLFTLSTVSALMISIHRRGFWCIAFIYPGQANRLPNSGHTGPLKFTREGLYVILIFIDRRDNPNIEVLQVQKNHHTEESLYLLVFFLEKIFCTSIQILLRYVPKTFINSWTLNACKILEFC